MKPDEAHMRELVVGADMPLNSSRYPIEALLETIADAARQRSDIHFVLAGRRDGDERFSVWNFLDQNKLIDRVTFLPYYDRCETFPKKKLDCWKWIPRDIAAENLNAQSLLSGAKCFEPSAKKRALFVTCFHPERLEGNSRLMRQWLDHLRGAGYEIHILHYATDPEHVTEDMNRRAHGAFEIWREVAVESRLVGVNKDGLNVHVDDWCGVEVITAVSELVSQFEYDVAIVNYAFMTAVFDQLANYTQKILLTHDSFADRNRRLHEQGYSVASWVSLDRRGEQEAFDRADIVVALQENEGRRFAKTCGDDRKIRVVSPIFAVSTASPAPSASGKLRIGYIGSGNWENEQNLARYLRAWLAHPELANSSEVVVGGGVCAKFADWVEDGRSLLDAVKPTMLGKVDDIVDFFNRCDIVVNPERGGTGIKIKTLEAMAAGMPVVSTQAGALGIGSQSRFHAAADPAELAALTAEIAKDRRALKMVREETTDCYRNYVATNRAAIDELLGPTVFDTRSVLRNRVAAEPTIPFYVASHAAGYQIALFENFFKRVDISGKRVLEIGSDFHLSTARLFAANGAAEVLAINMGDWKSAEPLPANAAFRAVGVSELAKEAKNRFDIVYGIAILEHLDDPEEVAEDIWNLLTPDGVAYLDGHPIWTGPRGHHVWVGGESEWQPLYAFNDPNLNPIPDWAHLAISAERMPDFLRQRGLPAKDAEKITNVVYNLDRKQTGSCSNFKTATQLINAFEKKFSTEAIRHTEAHTNEFFTAASEKYSESDLATIGLSLWLRPRRKFGGKSDHSQPLVSIIIPFYKVEAYIDACIVSVMNQTYKNIEAIFVDDASPDGSRAIVERHATKDSRIMLITHEKNQGLGPARNTGVRYASGEYLFFLDSDDFLTSRSAIRSLVDAAIKHGHDVVVGACQNLFDDGSTSGRDLVDAGGARNAAGGVVRGMDAFLAGMRISNEYYLPPRAWGALIARKFYDELALDYPSGEHEDMGHVPFLYAKANGVFFKTDIIVTYRNRSGSISQSPWTVERVGRYRNLWRHFKVCVRRFGLDEGLSSSALQHTWHVVWRLMTSGYLPQARNEAVSLLAEMLEDVTEVKSFGNFFGLMDDVRKFLGDVQDHNGDYQRVIGALPSECMLDYYCNRLGLPRHQNPMMPQKMVS